MSSDLTKGLEKILERWVWRASGTLLVFSFDGFGLLFSRFITGVTSFLCLAVAVGSTIVSSDVVGSSKTLHIQQSITNLTFTCFVMGFGLGCVSASHHLPSFDSFQTSFPCTTIGSLWPSSHLKSASLLHLHATKRAGEERCCPRCRTYHCRALCISTHMQRRRHHR